MAKENVDGGRKGGRQTAFKHGSEHMRKIGSLGGKKTAATHNMRDIGRMGGIASRRVYEEFYKSLDETGTIPDDWYDENGDKKKKK